MDAAPSAAFAKPSASMGGASATAPRESVASSGIAPSLEATTGVPATIASATTRPNPSLREHSTKTSSAFRTRGMSRLAPAQTTRSAIPRLAARARSSRA